MEKFSRNCPTCNKLVWHNGKGERNRAIKENRNCKSCRILGDKNPFYKIGPPSPNRKHPYDLWLNKYGKDVADQKFQQMKNKIGKTVSGSGNPMYGRPSPQGSGNGWSGWYKGWYFRSLHELSYMVNHIESWPLQWRSAETKEFEIKYEDCNGQERNYYPDFLINDKWLVEVKPARLANSDLVQRKAEAAKKFCQEKGYEYSIVTPKILTEEKMKQMYLDGEILFLPRYEQKFRDRYLPNAA